MLNQIHLEGFITKRIWPYDGETFFRLAVYRDPDRPQVDSPVKGKHNEKKHRPDYITIRVPTHLTTVPVTFEPGQRLQVHGWIESRQFEQSLAEFLENANGDDQEEIEIDPDLAEELTTNRVTTWVVAERIITLDKQRDAHT